MGRTNPGRGVLPNDCRWSGQLHSTDHSCCANSFASIGRVRQKVEQVMMKKYMSNIRIWRRLGIVLSVLWFVGFAGWVWVDTNHHNYDFLGVQLAACQATLPS